MWDRVVDWFHAVILNRCRRCDYTNARNAALQSDNISLKRKLKDLTLREAELKAWKQRSENTVHSLTAQLESSRREVMKQNLNYAAADNKAVSHLSVAQAQEIEVMRVLKTLEFYADKKNYWDGEDTGEFGFPVRFPSMAQTDGGEKARQALEDFRR